MKKSVKVVLGVAVALVGLAACTSGNDKQESTRTPETTSADAGEYGGNIINKTEEVVYEDDKIKITYKGIEVSSIMGDEVLIDVENKTDKNYVLAGDNSMVVNDRTMSMLTYVDVFKNTTTADSITLFTDDMEKAGIKAEDIETIKFGFDLYEADDQCESEFDKAIYHKNVTIKAK